MNDASGNHLSLGVRGRAVWGALNARERLGVALAAGVVALALLWLVALAPALKTLRQADTQRERLDTQLQGMQRLKAQADALKAQPRLGLDDALGALEQSVQQRLGSAGRLSVVGNRATVSLTRASATDLAAWLQEARVNVRAVPVEARLTRAGAPDAPEWSGTLSLALPAAAE
ncbi:MAG: type II secretion system protein M [Burkholderiaceae bacterium]|jgi:general secretion pathway protein M|nr:type II secretion system protein M [Burkholderiaceae bacterium]